MSRCSEDEVSTTTGIVWSFGSARIWRSTSMPSTFGNLRSRRRRRGRSMLARFAYLPRAKRKSRASAPSSTATMLLASRLFVRARIVSSRSSGLSSTRRISTWSLVMSHLLVGTGQGEREAGTLVLASLGAHGPAVTGDDALDDGEPDACSGEFMSVKTSEDAKKRVNVPHVEPCTVVTDPVEDVVCPLVAVDGDLCSWLRSGELQGVGEQVGPDLAQERRGTDRKSGVEGK